MSYIFIWNIYTELTLSAHSVPEALLIPCTLNCPHLGVSGPKPKQSAQSPTGVEENIPVGPRGLVAVGVGLGA